MCLVRCRQVIVTMKPDTNPNLDADYACMHNSFKACDFSQLHVIINFQNTFTTPHVGRCGGAAVWQASGYSHNEAGHKSKFGR